MENVTRIDGTKDGMKLVGEILGCGAGMEVGFFLIIVLKSLGHIRKNRKRTDIVKFDEYNGGSTSR